MTEFFGSIFDLNWGAGAFFLMLGVSLITGLLTSFILSFRMHSSSRFFITNAITVASVAIVVALINNIATAFALAGVFGLVRYRSAQGTSEEIGSIFISVAAGLAFGMGYLAYGVICSIIISLLYYLLTYLPIFEHKGKNLYKIVRVTIPEDLDYDTEFGEIFKHYGSEYEYLKIKTSDMGSLYKIEVKIKLKNETESKALLDELRQKNGNLEVALTPFIHTANQL